MVRNKLEIIIYHPLPFLSWVFACVAIGNPLTWRGVNIQPVGRIPPCSQTYPKVSRRLSRTARIEAPTVLVRAIVSPSLTAGIFVDATRQGSGGTEKQGEIRGEMIQYGMRLGTAE
jgi:hypothetical protein